MQQLRVDTQQAQDSLLGIIAELGTKMQSALDWIQPQVDAATHAEIVRVVEAKMAQASSSAAGAQPTKAPVSLGEYVRNAKATLGASLDDRHAGMHNKTCASKSAEISCPNRDSDSH
eukprot:TRINITY_DN11965_c0_g1_i2.p2 TRINITY_DN11965_c0_g1~~TRINITY_DN11965_c0_g1_i2.p2  ORF type:complete len:117 (-),score=21.98 TRINITY_DN11965_c0_g1_i2:1068-1418(-)